ncbi:MAG: hypothetical protein R3D84_04225 [Paracoccaceae bacterium]
MAAVAHPAFPQPRDRNCKVWRFMDFSKFVNLVLSKQLWLSRADLLGDPYEGAISPFTYDLIRQQLENDERFPNQRIESSVNDLRNFFDSTRRYTFVNCWHLNRHESAAMWKLYTKSDEAVALVSTYKKLAESLDENHYVGQVTYTDYESSPIPIGNAFGPFMQKRVSFSHENEIRVVRWHPEYGEYSTEDGGHPLEPPMVDGIAAPIELARLIDAVYVSPTAPMWFFKTVGDFIKSAGLDLKVIQSSLFTSPL